MDTVIMIYEIHINIKCKTKIYEGQRNPLYNDQWTCLYYKQDYVLLFTVNKENWPIRREY